MLNSYQKKNNLKILITDHVHSYLIDKLGDFGYEVNYLPNISWDEAYQIIGDYQGIVINTKMKMNKQMLDKTNGLKFIARLGSGLDIIDLEYCKAKKVVVINSPEGNRNAVAEHILGMLLMLLNKLKSADSNVRQGKWDREFHRGFELEGKTIGIIGYGNTGAQFARIISGMDVEIIVFDKYKAGFSKKDTYVKEVSLNDITSRADIISLHVPLSAETHYMVDAKLLSECRKNCILINSSRGNVVHLSSLVNALENGAISGACLDVLENEKPPSFTGAEQLLYERLYQLKNVVLSPHVAGWTYESKFKIAKILADKISAMKIAH